MRILLLMFCCCLKPADLISKDKIDSDGNYVPFLSYSIIAMCEITTQIEAMYDMFKSSPIAKYVKPLHYSTYHMTLFNIWNIREEFYPYQLKEGTPKRERSVMNDVMETTIVAAEEEIEKFPALLMSTLKVEGLGWRKNVLVINVDVVPDKKADVIVFRSWCAKTFGKSDSNLKFHITLGYIYKEITENLTLPYKRLDKWIQSHIPTIELYKPMPVIFSSMEVITSYRDILKLKPEPRGYTKPTIIIIVCIVLAVYFRKKCARGKRYLSYWY